MADEIGSVNVKIGADTSDLKKGVSSAKAKVGELRSTVNSGAKDFAKYGAAASVAGAAVALHLFKGSADAAREIKNLSRLAGEGTQTFQRLSAASATVGVPMDKLSDILKDVNDRVGDFVTTGGGPMVDFFENIAPKVGVTAKQFQNLSGSQSLQLYVDTLEKANVNQQEMTFFLEAMASDATALIPLLKNGGEGFALMAEKTEALGLALSDVELEKLSQSKGDLDRLAGTFSSLSNHVSAEFSPAVSAAVGVVQGLVIEAGGMDKVAGQAFDTVIDGALFAVDAVDGLKTTFEVTSRGISGALAGLASNFATVARGWVMLADLIPGVDMSGITADIAEFERLNMGFAAESLSEINDLMTDPLPSEGLRERLAVARELSDELAASAVAQPQGVEGEGAGFGDVGQAGRKAEIKELKAFLEEKAEMIAASKELALIAADNNMLYEDLRRSEQEQKEIDHLNAIYNSNASHERKVSALKNASSKARNAIAISEGRNALATIATFNKSAFKANKVFAISDALISTYQGIASALRLPFPLNIAAAASTAAMGFAQVSSIKSQSFGGGGGGGGGVSSGGGFAASPSVATGSASSGEAQQAQNINISGISATDLISGGQLVSVLNEAIGDGAKITGVN